MREKLLYSQLSESNPKIITADQTRKVLWVNFNDFNSEKRLCVKYGAESVLEAVTEYYDAAREFLEHFEDYTSMDQDRFEDAVEAAASTGGENSAYFVEYADRFFEMVRYKAFKDTLLWAVEHSVEAAQYFLSHESDFRRFRCFRAANRLAMKKACVSVQGL